MAEQIGLSEDGIKYHLGEMCKQGLIRHVGHTKGGSWKINVPTKLEARNEKSVED